FELMTYQDKTPDFPSCTPASLSGDLQRLFIPEIVYDAPDGEVRFTDVELQITTDAQGDLQFVVIGLGN
ncbi:MAG: hypothetical protein AAF512_10235, partial [Pseudomonadota bacterium]